MCYKLSFIVLFIIYYFLTREIKNQSSKHIYKDEQVIHSKAYNQHPTGKYPKPNSEKDKRRKKREVGLARIKL